MTKLQVSKLTSLSTTDKAYDSLFFNSIESGSLQSAQIVVPIVLDLISPRSVVDVGCGRGAWLKAFQENGVPDVFGLDGSYVDVEKLLIDRERFSPTDLAGPFTIEKTYDLAVCLEVAEHLPAKAAAGLVASLTKAAPAILFSAAVPGQSGTAHINEQWPSYWTKLFARHEFCRLDPVRRKVVCDERVDWWYRQNTYLYASATLIAQSTKLQAELAHANMNVMEYISRDVLGNYTTLSGLVRQLPRAILRAASRFANL
jgi:2-polyprenyl-3-methyl-5-hydroxy-6-metoxy-1,4-benzoquinol methylase